MNSSTVYFNQDRKEMVCFLPESYQRVLEVGCGAGGFAQWYVKSSELWGIEPDVDAARSAETSYKQLLCGTFNECADQLPNHYFDLVVCNDVIEHMPDSEQFFEKIAGKMVAGGRIIGSVPNVRYWHHLREVLVEKDWQYRDSGILDRTHLRFFTEKSLSHLIQSQGLTIEKLEGINPVRYSRFVMAFIILLSLGYYADIRYLQFGFCARFP